MSICKFDNVCKGFRHGTDRIKILRGITRDVAEGEFVAIPGFSGFGKTTLINRMARLNTPDTGSVTFRGPPIIGPRQECGLVFQSYSLMPWLTVKGNVLVEAVFPKLNRAEKNAKADHCIAMVGLAHVAGRRPGELSGGMRQCVSAARGNRPT